MGGCKRRRHKAAYLLGLSVLATKAGVSPILATLLADFGSMLLCTELWHEVKATTFALPGTGLAGQPMLVVSPAYAPEQCLGVLLLLNALFDAAACVILE